MANLAAVITVRPGREERVMRDVLDALYPHDQGIRVEKYVGLLAIYSNLNAEQLCELLRRYPIRGLSRVRRVIAVSEGEEDPGRALKSILARAAEVGLKFAWIEVRARGTAEGECLKSVALEFAKRLGVYDRQGLRARVEVLGPRVALTIDALLEARESKRT